MAESESGIVIYGTEESMISDVLLENVSIKISSGTYSETYGGNFDLRPVSDRNLGIFRHDIPALYSQYTDGLTIREFRVEWGENLPDYMSHAIYCKAYKDLTICDFDGKAAKPGIRAIELDDWKNAVIKP
jgi:hypothetical protein